MPLMILLRLLPTGLAPVLTAVLCGSAGLPLRNAHPGTLAAKVTQRLS